jgi:hypothetical protein
MYLFDSGVKIQINFPARRKSVLDSDP